MKLRKLYYLGLTSLILTLTFAIIGVEFKSLLHIILAIIYAILHIIIVNMYINKLEKEDIKCQKKIKN